MFQFRVARDGRLASAALLKSFSESPSDVAFHPSLPFAYFATKQQISQCRVKADGAIMLISSVRIPKAYKDAKLFVEPKGRFLYETGHNQPLLGFRIAQNGALSLMSLPVLPHENTPTMLAFDSTHDTAYVINYEVPISECHIRKDGTFLPVRQITIPNWPDIWNMTVVSPH